MFLSQQPVLTIHISYFNSTAIVAFVPFLKMMSLSFVTVIVVSGGEKCPHPLGVDLPIFLDDGAHCCIDKVSFALKYEFDDQTEKQKTL